MNLYPLKLYHALRDSFSGLRLVSLHVFQCPALFAGSRWLGAHIVNLLFEFLESNVPCTILPLSCIFPFE